MNEQDWLAERFEAYRPHLRAVAYRMLGALSEADDAIQETWLRLSHSDASAIANLGGWLTTVIARVCLDLLRSREARREEPLTGEDAAPEPLASLANHTHATDPEQEALLADSVGLALLVILDTLSPAERIAFVLHDIFDVSFEEIAPIVGRSPAAARQLASRARRRARGAEAVPDADLASPRAVVDAFLAASRAGEFDALLRLLDPEAVCHADAAAVLTGAPREAAGARAVAGIFSGRARVARLALVNGAPGAVWAPGGQPRVVFAFTVAHGRVTSIEMLADPARLAQLDLIWL
ncbi:MAG TPA: sigma-70 family RNA polymerase sigma factor [Ktedonobacterales bacterium]